MSDHEHAFDPTDTEDVVDKFLAEGFAKENARCTREQFTVSTMAGIVSSLASISRRSLALWSIALAVILFLSVNILARGMLVGARLDLTADKLFTLSQGTHKVLSQIDEPVTLRLYFSSVLGKELPGLSKYAGRVKDMIDKYKKEIGEEID